jgi:hypothetical protein
MKASTLSCPRDSAYFGADFRLGAYLPMFPPAPLANLQDAVLPTLPDGRILLDGAWEMPTSQNVDVFIDRLERAGLRSADRGAAARRRPQRAQGNRAEPVRARCRPVAPQAAADRAHAARLLRAGAAIVDVVFDAGYYDQPHLTRALRQLIGHTLAELARGAIFVDL